MLPKGGGVQGIVVDRHEKPVPGEIVVAVSPASMGGGSVTAGAGLYQGHSDANGAYMIEHMAPGSYFLVATRGDEDLNPMSFFGNWNFDLVTITAGEMQTQKVHDTSAGACKVYGTITYKGQPIERGNLSAVTFDTDNLLGVEWKAARMLGDGKFEFAGLAPGEYQLNLDNNGPQVRMPLEVLDVPEMRVDLRLPESGLQGTVIDETTKAPIAGCQVQLRSTEKVQASGMLGQLISSEGRALNQRSDENGKFAFERLSPGEYMLVARPPGGQLKVAEGASETRYAASDPVRVRIEENRTERDVVVALQPGLTLEGAVVDAHKSPVGGASVFVRQQGGASNAVEQASTDKQGHFKVSGLAPGVYRATATAAEYADGSRSDIKIERGAKPAECEIVLQKGVHVTVRVFAAGGAPASGARGDLFPLKGERTNDPASAGKAIQNLFSGEGASDENGRIDMGRYMPGEYRLEVQRGFSKAADPRVVLKADDTEVELRIDLP
jgi:protocatechuate 3,4-dioxygenase beta subunit